MNPQQQKSRSPLTKLPLLTRIFSFVDCFRPRPDLPTTTATVTLATRRAKNAATINDDEENNNNNQQYHYFDKLIQLSTVTTTWREAFVEYGAGYKSLQFALHVGEKNRKNNDANEGDDEYTKLRPNGTASPPIPPPPPPEPHSSFFRVFLLACENGFLWIVKLFLRAGVARDRVVWKNE